jgi:hypothetical protein
MSREEATRLEALPMQISTDGAVIVALAEPTDARLLALRSLLGDRIDCVVVAKTAIDAGLRSELLAKNARDHDVVSTSEAQPEAPLSLVSPEVDDMTTTETEPVGVFARPAVSVTLDTADVPEEHSTTDFDALARTLSDGLSAQLSSLRAIVVEAEAARARDGAEITRLTDELAGRTTELAERTTDLGNRNDTIVSMQQKLREFADTLEHTA